MFLPQEFIRKKRDRQPLSREEIAAFVSGITDGSVTEGQVAAFAMAVFFNDLAVDERVALTLAQRDSGQVLEWRSLALDGPVIDKHSTGGVGDVVSLMLGPMIAACGGYVPMISGRGLGHTGGTLDKLSAIPGYDVTPDPELLRRTVREVGVAIIGQTAQLAPADKRIYAIRDVTATVESVAMITASILSKKLAAGLDGLVMDVKVGSGAFMPSFEKSVELAQSIVDVGNGAGMKTTAVLTDMNQSLAPCAGNAIEVLCAIDYLSGKSRPARLHEVTMALTAEMLVTGGLATDEAQARARLAARARFRRGGRAFRDHGGRARRPEGPGRGAGAIPGCRRGEGAGSGAGRRRGAARRLPRARPGGGGARRWPHARGRLDRLFGWLVGSRRARAAGQRGRSARLRACARRSGRRARAGGGAARLHARRQRRAAAAHHSPAGSLSGAGQGASSCVR